MKRPEEKLNKSFDELLQKYDEELKEIKSEYKKTEEEIEAKLVSELKEIEREKNIRQIKKRAKKKKERNKRFNSVLNILSNTFKRGMKFFRNIGRRKLILISVILLISILTIALLYHYTIIFDSIINSFKSSESPVPNSVYKQ